MRGEGRPRTCPGGSLPLPDEERPEEHEPDVARESGPVDPGAETIESEPGSEPGSQPSTAPSPSRRRRSRPSETTSLRGQEFGEYHIVAEVARGAMGIVYRAEQKSLGREVALKVLLAGEHASDAEIRRFTREAQALARLKHPNIVPIYDIGEVNGRHFFTMDFIEGQTLSQELSERQLTVTEALHIIEQVADAVAAAHTRGVIHRDIKPSNIMLDSDGGVHIMDFGLAKSTGTETKHTRDGTTIGTPAYMPPEQAKGDISRVDERSDLYSIGAVLYEMLAGRPPFGGTNLLEIVLAVINEDPPPPRSVNPRLPRELETIVVKCMEKDPARRYHTAAELRDEIRRYRDGEPIRAQPPSFLYRARKMVRRHWVALSMVATVLIVAAGAYGYVTYILQQQEIERVEGSKPQWKQIARCEFDPGPKTTDWQAIRSSYADAYLDPVSALPKPGKVQDRELVSDKLVYGSARAVLDFELAAPLGKRPLGLGFSGDRVSCIFRLSPGRLQLAVTTDPDSTVPSAKVVADRRLPALSVGKAYRATAERRGMTLRFRLEEVPEVGKPTEVVRLAYARLNLSHWRYKNLNVVLRGGREVLRPRLLVIETLLLPRLASALVGADSMFYRGDYNGALEQYNAIINPAEGGGAPPSLAEQAAAHCRLGLYYEIKRQPDEALGHYEQARKLADEVGKAGEADEVLKAARSEALLREMAVHGRSGQAGRVFSLLAELETLDGPWMWDMGELVKELAKRRDQVRLARDLTARLRAPGGSAVLGRNVKAVAWALVRDKRGTDLERLVATWVERLGPEPAPLLDWARLAAEAGAVENCTRLFRIAARRLKPGNRELVYHAEEACKVFSRRRQFADVPRVIAAAGGSGLKKAYLDALDEALAPKGRAGRDQALKLLAFARDRWAEDAEIAKRSLRLAEAFCAAGAYRTLGQVWRAYPTKRLVDVYLKAIRAVHDSDAPVADALDLLREARRNFGDLHVGLAQLAAEEIGAKYAECRNEGDYRLVRNAHEAYPSPLHLSNFVTAFESLISKARPRYDRAGALFAYARANLGPDARLAEAVRVLVENPPRDEDLAAFMRQLATVEQALAGRRAQLATWRLELARYHLLAGGVREALETYERVWDKRAGAPRSLAVEARLRRGLFRALGTGRGAPKEAEMLLGEVLKTARKKSRARAIATAVLEKSKLDTEAFRKTASRLKLSRSEVELVLAAAASLAGDQPAKNEHLSRAYAIITTEEKSTAWPYEVLKLKVDAALRSHG